MKLYRPPATDARLFLLLAPLAACASEARSASAHAGSAVPAAKASISEVSITEASIPADEAPEAPAACCAQDTTTPSEALASSSESTAPVSFDLPDVTLVDQHGDEVRLDALIEGKSVAINFIFTTCTTICPPLTANFAALQDLLGERGLPVELISISIDPTTDSPERLAAWAESFGAEPNWTFLTGDKRDIDSVLKALGAFTAAKEDHSPIVLLGHAPAQRWRRVDGFAGPEVLADVLAELRRLEQAAPAPPETTPTVAAAGPAGRVAPIEAQPASTSTVQPDFVNSSAKSYFTDVELIDQHGKPQRLYTDLIRGKTVVIHCFFTACTGVCPVLTKNMAAIQAELGERVGADVHLISLSVDPLEDTPPLMSEYARRLTAQPGWYFLTGERENVTAALAKLGLSVETREQHSNVFLIGNDRTGLWKKAFGLAQPDEIVPIVRSVLDDDGEDS